MPLLRFSALLLLALAWLPEATSAQEFAAVVSPPRFEDRARPGTIYRNVIEVTNTSTHASRFSIQTADWNLDDQGAPVFDQALAPESCRPWVGLEASEITIPGGAKRRFRFEVAVPEGAPRGECRFAIMIEGDPQPPQQGAPLPISGRIGVIVYLAVGDAAAALDIAGMGVITFQGQSLPYLKVLNKGDMHSRLDGFLAGVDAEGTRMVLVPDNGPILVGATRDIPLYPQAERDGDPTPTIAFPLRMKGRLDADRQRLDIDATVDR